MDGTTPRRHVAIVAGEASGDLHGAKLVAAMRRRAEGLAFSGIGGRALRAAGVRLVAEASDLAVVGVTEVLARLPAIRRALRAMRALLRDERPDLLILIDFPDFNLRVAAAARRLGVPVLYFISPQLWAWRTGRVRQVRRRVDHMAVILPFEEAFYRARGVTATFVGHPLLDQPLPGERAAARRWPGDAPVVGLLPGSRRGEVARHLPLLLAAAAQIAARRPAARFVVSQAESVDPGWFRSRLEAGVGSVPGLTVAPGVDAVLARSHVAVAASGTVTLEAALHGVPMVIVYQVSRLTYAVGRLLVRGVRHIGLVNLVAGKTLAPELINAQATPANIRREVERLLADAADYAARSRELAALRHRLGGPGASERTAAIALGLLGMAPAAAADGA
jgi:lipid-A-disaccharide synthase